MVPKLSQSSWRARPYFTAHVSCQGRAPDTTGPPSVYSLWDVQAGESVSTSAAFLDSQGWSHGSVKHASVVVGGLSLSLLRPEWPHTWTAIICTRTGLLQRLG